MNEPLIVVEGNLRLPTVRPLADPSLKFGREWSPARARPSTSRSEIPLYGARFNTKYSRMSDSSDSLHARSPYQATSIWGKLAKNATRSSTSRMKEPAAPVDAAAERKPMRIDLRTPSPLRKRPYRIGSFERSTIAIAVSALFVWVLFAHEQWLERSGSKPAVDDAEQMQIGQAVSRDRPADATRVPTVSQPADPRPVDPTQPVAPRVLMASRPAHARETKPAPVSVHAEASHTRTPRYVNAGAHRAKRAATKPVIRYAASTHRGASTKPTQLTAAPRTTEPLNVAALYSMLQHSPTLDSNVASRPDNASANQAR
ncbi:hypothetical protein [Caballeronia sp. GAFFF2]|uniref:hypothetical protein n=1 Tax=Caballeronia sp. GAFFF2 TaxID=2921741 RepID=UPI002029469B|nr:hypothetical protein [Caballeronia sp. GAFFF2]